MTQEQVPEPRKADGFTNDSYHHATTALQDNADGSVDTIDIDGTLEEDHDAVVFSTVDEDVVQ